MSTTHQTTDGTPLNITVISYNYIGHPHVARGPMQMQLTALVDSDVTTADGDRIITLVSASTDEAAERSDAPSAPQAFPPQFVWK